jgi:Zn ribbon nucleic-acid-binding protein
MTQQDHDDLWRDFPKTATEFEARFATEEDCQAYWIKARWGGKPACARCRSTRVWTERDGFLFECADCGHQTSLTSGTLLEKTRKPFKTWFRAVFEIAARRNGISAKDLQQGCHWTISLLKRWLLGTHGGAVRDKHLQAYLDEFAFRHNRRKTNGVGRIAARVIQQLVVRTPLPMRKIIDETKRCRWFGSAQGAVA